MKEIVYNKFQLELNKLKVFLPDYLRIKGIDTTRNFKCINPAHNDSNPSMGLFHTDDGVPLAHCFSCDVGTVDIFKAAYLIENKPLHGKDFVEQNVKYLANLFQIDLDLGHLDETSANVFEIYKLYQDIANYICNVDQLSDVVIKELESRNWSIEEIVKRNIGSVLDFDSFITHLKQKLGYSQYILEISDVYNKKIFNKNSLIFTVKDESGKPVGFAARNLRYDGVKNSEGILVNGPKFINTSTKNLNYNVYDKVNRLYLLNECIAYRNENLSTSKLVYVFEGYGDALTAHLNELQNSVAIGSLGFTVEHFNVLRENGIYNIVVCFDNDKQGVIKAKSLIDEIINKKKNVEVKIMFIPNPDNLDKIDPDLFIRTYGIQEFLKIEKHDVFTWRLIQFQNEDVPIETIIDKMLDIIIAETSNIRKESMLKRLAEFYEISLSLLKEDYSNKVKLINEKSNYSTKAIVENLLETLKKDDASPVIEIEKALDKINHVNKEQTSAEFEFPNQIKMIWDLKNSQESSEDSQTLKLGDRLKIVEQAFLGDMKSKMVTVGGTANAGKTSFLVNLNYYLTNLNEDIICVLFSLDDGIRDILPRFVTLDMCTRNETDENFHLINMNRISSFSILQNDLKNNIINQQQFQWIVDQREASYNNIIANINKKKNIFLDSVNGHTVEYLTSVVKNLVMKYPEKHIIVFLDSFHITKLSDTEDMEMARDKTEISRALKMMTQKYGVTLFMSAEYRKFASKSKSTSKVVKNKPSNEDLKDSNQLEYDCNAIVHLYNELHDLREACSSYYIEPYSGNKYPIIEGYFGKNKISSFKGNFNLLFYPEKAYYTFYDIDSMNTYASEDND